VNNEEKFPQEKGNNFDRRSANYLLWLEFLVGIYFHFAVLHQSVENIVAKTISLY
jgi:hypothetical protein